MSEHKCNDKTPLVDAALAHQGDTHTDVTIRLMNLTRVARDLEIRLRQTLSASKRMVNAGIKNEHEIEQILGKALGYPWFKDDQKNFPGATEEHGVCVGEHVAVTLAMEAAERIKDGDMIVERLHRIVKRDAQLRRDIDAALNVTPEERQAETGAGLQGAVALLIKNIEKLMKERDEALARPSQHEGAHATCWAEVERLQAALAQAQTDALRYQKLKELAGTDEGWGVLETVFGDTSVEGWDAAIDSIEMQDTGTAD
jgi:hypothetical protein